MKSKDLSKSGSHEPHRPAWRKKLRRLIEEARDGMDFEKGKPRNRDNTP